MKDVLSLATFAIGALCFVVFVTIVKSRAGLAAVHTDILATRHAIELANRALWARRRSESFGLDQERKAATPEKARNTEPMIILGLISMHGRDLSRTAARGSILLER
jgi:hypothetical protein